MFVFMDPLWFDIGRKSRRLPLSWLWSKNQTLVNLMETVGHVLLGLAAEHPAFWKLPKERMSMVLKTVSFLFKNRSIKILLHFCTVFLSLW